MNEKLSNIDNILKRVAAYDQQAKQEQTVSTNAITATKAANINAAIDHIKHGRFIVGSFSADLGLSFSETPAVHFDSGSARKECKRLAAMHPGKLFLFVKLSGAEMMPTVQSVSV